MRKYKIIYYLDNTSVKEIIFHYPMATDELAIEIGKNKPEDFSNFTVFCENTKMYTGNKNIVDLLR